MTPLVSRKAATLGDVVDDLPIECERPGCGWSGTIHETILTLNEFNNGTRADCPKCLKYIRFVKRVPTPKPKAAKKVAKKRGPKLIYRKPYGGRLAQPGSEWD